MLEISIHKSDVVSVTYISNLYLGKMVWYKKPSDLQYKEAFGALLNFANKSKVIFFMSDVTNQGVISPDVRKWFEEIALPKAIDNGLQKAAVVLDANPFKRYYINMILKATNKYKLDVKLFGTQEDAISWLK